MSTTRRIVASAVRIERAQVAVFTALRCTIGVAVPLLGGIAMGRPTAGVFGAAGALSVGFGSFQGVYRSRAATMLMAAAGMAISIFVGSIAGHSGVVTVVVAALWAFGSGYIVALGPAATFVGTQSAVALLVAAGFPVDLQGAVGRFALVLAGGLVQTLLLVAVWPLRRFTAERHLVSSVYRSLADYARSIPAGQEAPPEPNTLGNALLAMADPQPLARTGDLLVFFALLDEAERIRASLAALALRRRVLEAQLEAGAPVDPGTLRATKTLAAGLAGLLYEIAEAVEDGREPDERPGQWDVVETAGSAIEDRRAAVRALLGQVRAAWRTASVPTPTAGAVPGADERRVVRPLRRRPLLQDSINTLRANFTLRSTACRHALRSGIAVGIAMAMYEAWPIERGYWVALTALLVLRPEFHETFVRGLARVGGTLAGAGCATLINWAFQPGETAAAALVLVCVFAGYALVRANYADFSIFITGYVVFLLVLAGVPETEAARYRVVGTLAGGALALAVYGIWPSWEGGQARELIAELLDAHRGYVVTLLRTYAGGIPRDLERLQEIRAAARLARSNAEASVERLQKEPRARQAIGADTAISLLATLRRNALAALALHADLERGAGRPDPGILLLADQFDAAWSAVVDAIRYGTPLGEFPPLRMTQQDLVAPGGGSIADETDLMVDSLETIGEIVRTRLQPESGEIRVTAGDAGR
jgi:uncharacterized membrane protein YccC